MIRGGFITLEGGEGAGKSTQGKLLAEFIGKHGHETILTREVGGCSTAEAIRNLWLTAPEGEWDTLSELLLIFAARREHLAKTVLPGLARGAFIVCDRYTDSTRVYQGGALGLGVERVDTLQAQIGAPEPDLTILLDIPVGEGLRRMKSRGGQDDRYQRKSPAFHQVLRDNYLALAKAHPVRFAVIDAMLPPDDVAAEIQSAVKKRFHLK